MNAIFRKVLLSLLADIVLPYLVKHPGKGRSGPLLSIPEAEKPLWETVIGHLEKVMHATKMDDAWSLLPSWSFETDWFANTPSEFNPKQERESDEATDVAALWVRGLCRCNSCGDVYNPHELDDGEYSLLDRIALCPDCRISSISGGVSSS